MHLIRTETLSNNRKVFYVDIGKMPKEEAKKILKKLVADFRAKT